MVHRNDSWAARRDAAQHHAGPPRVTVLKALSYHGMRPLLAGGLALIVAGLCASLAGVPGDALITAGALLTGTGTGLWLRSAAVPTLRLDIDYRDPSPSLIDCRHTRTTLTGVLAAECEVCGPIPLQPAEAPGFSSGTGTI